MRISIDLILFFFNFFFRLRRPLLQPDVRIRIMARYRRRMVQTKPPNLHSSHNRRRLDRPRHPVFHRALHLSLVYSSRKKCRYRRRRRCPEDKIRTGKSRSVPPRPSPSTAASKSVDQSDADVGGGSAPAGSAKKFRVACVGGTIDGWFRGW